MYYHPQVQQLEIGQWCQMSPARGSCFVTESVLLAAAALMSEVYDDHKDKDGFLYITYSGEHTFG